MLGATLVKEFAADFEVYATGNSNFENQPPNYKVFDLGSDSYAELIEWSKPNVIIHSAALTNGNYCDKNPLEALNINGVSLRKFSEVIDSSVKLIYISTDAVFPSELHLAKENDVVNPESVYGKSKELGEYFLINSDTNYTIVRTTIVGFNENQSRQGFVEWIIKSAIEQQEIGLFDDVIFTPISIFDLAAELQHIIRTNKNVSEKLHVAGSEVVTKYEFGVALLTALGLSTQNVKATSINSMADRAKRCADQSFNCENYQSKYNRTLPNLAQTVKSLKKYYDEQH